MVLLREQRHFPPDVQHSSAPTRSLLVPGPSLLRCLFRHLLQYQLGVAENLPAPTAPEQCPATQIEEMGQRGRQEGLEEESSSTEGVE